MIRILFCLLLLLFIAAKVVAQSYFKEFRAFARQDQQQLPPAGGIVFTGSSSIRLWPALSDAFPEKEVLNRGFGGSTLPELEQNLDKVVFPYQPRQVVIYSGDNDIAKGASAQEVLLRFEQVFKKIRAALPQTSIVFISIKPSPARSVKLSVMQEANTLIRQFLEQQQRTAYVDVMTPMLRQDGTPRQDIFLQDGLHLTAKGYGLWQEVLAPVLD